MNDEAIRRGVQEAIRFVKHGPNRTPLNLGRNAAKRKAREQAKRYKGPAKTPRGG